MRIGMLNISIGKYAVFWKEFFISAELNFLPGHEKHYFVFTDCMELYGKEQENVTIIRQSDLGWPFNTMKRFHMFKKIKILLENYDYIFFINGNAVFKQKMTERFINPNKEIITILHPGLYGTSIEDMPFERNQKSKAYIPSGEGRFYVQGAFIGGKSSAFIDLVDTLDRLTEEDLKNDIIAVWHDESFLNKYILNRSDVQIMGREYLYYEEYVFPWEPIIMLRNKRKYGDLNHFRGNRSNRFREFKHNILLKIRNDLYKILIRLEIVKQVKYLDSKGQYLDTDFN